MENALDKRQNALEQQQGPPKNATLNYGSSPIQKVSNKLIYFNILCFLGVSYISCAFLSRGGHSEKEETKQRPQSNC